MNNIIVIDTETTGVNISQDRIVQFGYVKLNADYDTIEEKERLINPIIPISKEATEIHGITDEMVKGQPTFKQISVALHSLLSECEIICGYNSIAFDIPLLYAEFSRAGIDWDYHKHKFIDACTIFKRKEPRDLTAALNFYCGIQMNEQKHSALYDAKCTGKVLAAQLSKYDLSDENELALFSNYDKPIVDMAGWFDAEHKLTRGKSKGTQDRSFIENWLLKQDFLLPDARKICNEILAK